jgi:hypothetical protein
MGKQDEGGNEKESVSGDPRSLTDPLARELSGHHQKEDLYELQLHFIPTFDIDSHLDSHLLV